MEWFVYVLLNRAGIAYTGIAKDVAARLLQHNAGSGAKFTRGRGPWRQVHVEGPMTRGDALRREIAIKRDAAFKATLKTRPRTKAQTRRPSR
jgi:putative endonuclease